MKKVKKKNRDNQEIEMEKSRKIERRMKK